MFSIEIFTIISTNMNRTVPDLIRGIRMVHYQCFRSKMYKHLSLTSSAVTVDVGLCRAKSKTVGLFRTYSNMKQKKEAKVDVNDIKTLENKGNILSNSGDDFKNLMNSLSCSENIESESLKLLKHITELTTVSPEKRVQIAEKLFEELRSLKVKITEEHYIGLLECYCASKCFPSCENFLSNLENDCVQLSETLQKSISKCLSQIGGFRELVKIINHLKKSGSEINESMQGGLIYSYAISGNVDKALKEYDKITGSSESENRYLNFSLLRVFIHQGNEVEFRDKLSNLIILGYKFTDDEIQSLFEEILLHQHLQLLPHMAQAVGRDVLLESLPNILKKLVDDKNVDNAFALLQSLYSNEGQNFQLPKGLYEQLIDALDKINHPLDDVIKKCVELRKIEGCQYVMEYLLYTCLSNNKMSESAEVIYALAENSAPVEPHYFWPLLIQAHERFGVEGVCHVVDMMFAVGICPDVETLVSYVYPYLDKALIFKYLRLLSSSGRIFQFFSEVFVLYAVQSGYYKECLDFLKRRPLDSLVKHYFLEEAFVEAMKDGKLDSDLVKLMKLTNGIDPYVAVAKLWSRGQVDRLRTVLQLFIDQKVSGRARHAAEMVTKMPHVPTDIKKDIEILLKFYRQKTNTSNREVEKESMYECWSLIEKAEVHLAELRDKKMNVMAQLFKLIKYYMKVGFYNKALKFRDEMLEKMGPRPQLSPSLLACMCKLYEYEEDRKAALDHYLYIREHSPTFLFDVPKSTGICYLFVRERNFDQLKALINGMPRWWGDVTLIEHKMVRILREVASVGNPDLTNEIFELMLKKGLIKVTKNSLMPFIDTYIALNDYDAAVNELFGLMRHYSIIPGTNALLWKLILAREFGKMEDILKLVTSRTKSDHIIISTLKMLACLGDEVVLGLYFEKYKIPVTDPRLPHVLGWEFFGGDMSLRMIAFKTFMTNVKPSRSDMMFYANLALDHICCERKRYAAEDFSNFLEENGLLAEYMDRLDNVIALTKTFERTMDRKVLYGHNKEKDGLEME